MLIMKSYEMAEAEPNSTRIRPKAVRGIPAANPQSAIKIQGPANQPNLLN